MVRVGQAELEVAGRISDGGCGGRQGGEGDIDLIHPIVKGAQKVLAGLGDVVKDLISWDPQLELGLILHGKVGVQSRHEGHRLIAVVAIGLAQCQGGSPQDVSKLHIEIEGIALEGLFAAA